MPAIADKLLNNPGTTGKMMDFVFPVGVFRNTGADFDFR